MLKIDLINAHRGAARFIKQDRVFSDLNQLVEVVTVSWRSSRGHTFETPRLRHLFQVVQTQTTTAYCRIYYYLYWTATFEIYFSGSSDTNQVSLLQNTINTGPPHSRYIFQVVQTQTTTAYKLIVEYYLHWTTTFEISFSGSSNRTNHDSSLLTTLDLHGCTPLLKIHFYSNCTEPRTYKLHKSTNPK